MSSVKDGAAERIPAEARRASILAAASRVFGERGYIGATTDQIAQAAGISQPYVVRMFGGKEALFLEVLERALQRLIASFRQAIALSRAAGDDEEELHLRLSQSYADLIEDRGLLLSLMQAFIMGHDPVIGESAREGFKSVYRLLRDEGGMTMDEARDFMAGGMLFNTLIALRLTDEYGRDETSTELITCTFRSKLDTVLGAQAGQRTGILA